MVENITPLWHAYATQLCPVGDLQLERRIALALDSSPVAVQRAMLVRVNRRVESKPILWKYLPGPYLRFFFPVSGANDEIDRGTVVALVLLYDPESERTLYAHSVFAGPESNPMLKHLDGPMASPMAQEGRNGELATRRFLEHKQALWHRFKQERKTIDLAQASRRWLDGFYWALLRLYFCERCPACRWGDSRFEGSAAAPYRPEQPRVSPEHPPLAEEANLIDAIVSSDIWQLEVAYANRGGFTVLEDPRLVKKLDSSTLLAIFPTTVESIEGGTIVGVAVCIDCDSETIRCAFVLHAGPEPEPQFLFGDRALGLPPLATGACRAAKEDAYVAGRRAAWVQFRLDELELGIHEASGNWLDGCWSAVEQLLHGEAVPAAV